jgi:hypothetical protein
VGDGADAAGDAEAAPPPKIDDMMLAKMVTLGTPPGEVESCPRTAAVQRKAPRKILASASCGSMLAAAHEAGYGRKP